MKFVVKATVPTEAGNQMISDPSFLQKIKDYVKNTRAEGAYFYESGDHRTMTFIVDMQSTDKMPILGEPLFNMGANVELHPVMTLQDLEKAIQNIPK